LAVVERVVRTTVPKYEQVLGDTHPDTLNSRNNLANAPPRAKLYGTEVQPPQ
jgi:hypothetical protein